ncbi:MAG: SWIM zinc finger family protein [Ktedonobacterales bacterium]
MKMNLTIYRALDDDTLAALANRGLLRRASRDLEQQTPDLRDDTAEAITFTIESATVTMPPTGPAQARCDCPADGCCRHILTAALYLRTQAEQAPQPSTDPDATSLEVSESPETAALPRAGEGLGERSSDEIMALGEAELVAWATRAIYKQGLDDITAGEQEVEITTEGGSIVFRFLFQNTTARWLIGAGLGGTICSCKRWPACRHRIAAILAWQREHGRALPGGQQRMLQASAGAPRTRAEVLASTCETLEELLALGFGALSQNSEDRLRTLAISAHGVDLPLLSRRLRALADLVRWQLIRDVRADTALLVRGAAHVYALAVALGMDGEDAPAPARLVGEHRSRYFETGGLEVIGVGAQQWRTRSGQVGLTVYFWDAAAHNWASWSESRASFYRNSTFDPKQRYTQGEIWSGAPAPQLASRCRIHLNNARRNRAGALSAHAGSQAFVTGVSDPAAIDFDGCRFDDWGALTRHLAQNHTGGLAEGDRNANLVVIAPTAWGEPTYDQRRQTLLRPVRDAAGRWLLLTMPHTDQYPFAVNTLRDVKPDESSVWGMLGFARITADGLELTPITLYRHPAGHDTHKLHTMIHLTLDGEKQLADAGFQGAPQSVAEILAGKTADTESELPDATRAPVASVADVADALADDDADGDANGEDGIADDEFDVENQRDSSAVGAALGATMLLVERLAERGARVSSERFEGELRDLTERLRQLGLTLCADALAALGDALASNRHRAAPDAMQAARALLHGAYVATLVHDDVTVTRALASVGA